MKPLHRRSFPLLLSVLLSVTAVTSFAGHSDYGDFSKFGTASSEVDGNLRLGQKIDEDDRDGGLIGGLLGDVLGLLFTPDSTATSDDASQDQDEDGVVVPTSI